MRQLVIPRYGPPEVLEVREASEPRVEPGTVRIRVHAAGINFSDLLARQGLYPDAPKPPCTIGYEVAGAVDAVSEGVTTIRRGDLVIATTRFGGQSELVVVPASSVFPLPPGWTFEQGAAFPVVYLTAHHMLVRVAAVQRGETVLVHAAGGGVGLAVAELGRIFGFRVLGLASFALVDAWKMRLLRTVRIKGSYSFDALSPDVRYLYLVEHVSAQDYTRYRVRAYDLTANRLLQQVIVDKREPNEVMRGYPVGRVTSRSGGWVYTLYMGGKMPFVHALDAAHEKAVCLDFHWKGSQNALWQVRMSLSRDESRILLRGKKQSVAVPLPGAA